MTSRHHRCRGFTLVELLVVTAIMATLFGLVLSGAKPGTSGQIRQAAQSLASALTATQSRALGNPAGAALILESGTASGLSWRIATRALNGDVPPFVTGTTSTSGLPFPPATSSVTVTLVPTNADTVDLVNGYRIRFGGSSVQGAYQPPSDWFGVTAGNSGSATVRLRTSAGQTVANTIWPAPTTTSSGSINPLAFQVARYPSAADVAVQLPKFAAIDLRYSGIDDDPSTEWGSLASVGAIGIVFNSVGGVEAVMQQIDGSQAQRDAVPPINPVQPIYFLLSPRDDVDGGTAPALSNPASLWLAIHPQTGRVTVAPNVPQATSDATAVRAARAKARALVVDRK
jgi:prepilin-type N-terminal cleavage/methylation domain-containing protein